MARNVFLASILVFLVVADVSNASFFWPVRKLAAPSPNEHPNVSPLPSAATDAEHLSLVGGEEKGKENQNQPTPATNPGEEKPKGDQTANNTGLTAATDTKEENKTPKEEVKEKGENESNVRHGVKESCNDISQKCRDTKSMIACVQSFDDVSKALVLLIQNEGNSSIKVDLAIPPSVDKKKLTDVPKHQTEMVNVALPNGGSNEIRLSAGNGDCVLHLGAPASQGNFFKQLPSYSKFMTPVYGAYLSFAIILIVGGVWACLWFRKTKSHSEIQYQELEMSVPETAAAVESAEGWDQVWDDDWDEEKAVKSPGAPSVSANGLTSRTPNRDGWEDWDD